jgi:hypothetical protein
MKLVLLEGGEWRKRVAIAGIAEQRQGANIVGLLSKLKLEQGRRNPRDPEKRGDEMMAGGRRMP